MPKSSSHAFGAKTYYRPIEAAVRWCGHLRFEQRILEALEQRAMPEPGEFPRWPLLRLYAERIFVALTHGELPGGKAGIVLDSQRPALGDPQLAVRHGDLEARMAVVLARPGAPSRSTWPLAKSATQRPCMSDSCPSTARESSVRSAGTKAAASWILGVNSSIKAELIGETPSVVTKAP